jgi:tryptophan halogenase
LPGGAAVTDTVQQVVVVGGGSSAWVAAAGLRRAFGKRGVEVTVVDTGIDANAPLVHWTLASQRAMHALLGIQESELLRRTDATFKLGIEHIGWQGAESRFLHAHGDIGTEFAGTPFYKYLLMQAIAGKGESPELYSVAALAARHGRFARPMGGDQELSASFTYGFHLDEVAYASFLREHALKLGVRRVAGPLVGVEQFEGGAVRALRLENGETLGGELFVDCSGSEALLMNRLSSARDDWSSWLPADRLLMTRAPAMGDPPAMTRTFASEAGWMWHVPQMRSSFVGHVYSSRFTRDDAAFAELGGAAPGLQPSPRIVRLDAGRRRSFWEQNCVALGTAAMQLEPLAGTELHFAQLGLGTLIELFPLRTPNAVEGAEYNRVMAEQADALRDFTIAHYRGGAQRPGAFWAAARALPPPDRLAHRLELYAAGGRLNMMDFETFEEVDWAWLLLGARVIPQALELQIRSQLEKIDPQRIAALRVHVERIAASMPRHGEYLMRSSGQGSHARH